MDQIAAYLVTIDVEFTYHSESDSITFDPLTVNPEYLQNVKNLVAAQGKTYNDTVTIK